MAGNKADMVFTDPPYNIDFSGTMGCTSKDGKMISIKDGYKVPNSQYDDIKNDKKNSDDFNVFISDIVSNIKEYCVGGWYICFASSTLHELLVPLISKNMKWKSIIIWNKNQSPMGGGHFRKKYEPIVYGYFNNFFYGKEYAEDDVWDVKRTLKNDLHPTMKPIELVEKAVGFSSNSSGIVLDFFGGSGSTLIACEKTKRHCYMMELDPKYCDVIIKRWQDFTGQEATHAETGKRFN
jgi:DNA modification methylase